MGYFIATTSGRKGPFSDGEIRQLVDAGRVPPGVRLFDDMSGETVSAGDVAEGRVTESRRPPAPSRRRSSRVRPSARAVAPSGRRGLGSASRHPLPAPSDDDGHERPLRYRRRVPIMQRTGLVVVVVTVLLFGGFTGWYLVGRASRQVTLSGMTLMTPIGWRAKVDPSGGIELYSEDPNVRARMMITRSPSTGGAPTKAEMIARLRAGAQQYPNVAALQTVITSHYGLPATRMTCSMKIRERPVNGLFLAIFPPGAAIMAIGIAPAAEFARYQPLFTQTFDSLRIAE